MSCETISSATVLHIDQRCINVFNYHNNGIGLSFEGGLSKWQCFLLIVLNSFFCRRITIVMTEQISNPLRELANDAIEKVQHGTATIFA